MHVGEGHIVTQTSTRNVTFRQAFNEAIRQEMERDQTIFVMGEDVAGAAGRAHLGFIDHFGGSFALTKGLIQQFGPERIRDTPISEAGFIGAGVGARGREARHGGHPRAPGKGASAPLHSLSDPRERY